MRILVIDNNIESSFWGAEDLRRFCRKVPGATFHVRRAPHDDLPLSSAAFDRVVVSGSLTSCRADAPWISRLLDFIRNTVDSGKPYLGVCYGHQSLVRAIGGKELMGKAAVPEFGWTRIEILAESPLLQGLPKEFYSFSSHFEEVTALPRGMKHLARSEDCAIQACQLGDRPVFGIQFHPERDIAGGEKSFAERKKEGEPKHLLGYGRSKELFNPKVGETIFRNFFEHQL